MHAYMHTYIHTRTHARMHTCIHARGGGLPSSIVAVLAVITEGLTHVYFPLCTCLLAHLLACTLTHVYVLLCTYQVPAVVIEGTARQRGDPLAESDWVEIPFRYAPYKEHRPPRRTAPHQPRLDWQMWFAALGSYQSNPWLLHLM